jgi:hypothetical protein
MATSKLASPEVPQSEADAQTTEPIETIRFPDGSIQPAYELALIGLEVSLQAGVIDKQTAVQKYTDWDPEFPEADIYRHINSR